MNIDSRVRAATIVVADTLRPTFFTGEISPDGDVLLSVKPAGVCSVSKIGGSGSRILIKTFVLAASSRWSRQSSTLVPPSECKT